MAEAKQKKRLIPNKVFSRIRYWMIYGVLFAIFPLFMSIPNKVFLTKFQGLKSFSESTELIYFSIYICASTMADMANFSEYLKSLYDRSEQVSKDLLMLIIVISAIIYGTIITLNISLDRGAIKLEYINIIKNFRLFILYSQILIAFMSFIFTGIIQTFIGIIEEKIVVEMLNKEVKK